MLSAVSVISNGVKVPFLYRLRGAAHSREVTTKRVVCGEERLDKLLDGTWEEFEQWIRGAIGLDFRWCIRPWDTTESRVMVASLVLEDIKRRKGFSLKRTHLSREY